MTLYQTPGLRLRRLAHRWTDPLRSVRSQIRTQQALASLPDGEVSAGCDVPYVCQFASQDRVEAYIHHGFQGRDDPNWAAFGAPDPDTYQFWAHRACAIACIKMAASAFGHETPSMWVLIEEGIALGGYRTHDEHGRFIDQGWLFPALVRLGGRYGLQVSGGAYASHLEVYALIRAGWLVAPAVTPWIGERGPLHGYDGHFVLTYAFRWRASRPDTIRLHNPSGRYVELQAGAELPAARFRAAFAHRYMAFRLG